MTRILIVDDRLDEMGALIRLLQRRFDIVLANDPAVALGMVASDRSLSVIISDLEMPGMDGITLLAKISEIAPNPVRMLLTGRAKLESVIAAVNEGHIFHFLRKPCPADQMITAILKCQAQFDLLEAERVLLEQTLHGSIAALVEVLGLAQPVSFGRSDRVKRLVADLAASIGAANRWEIDVAAMLAEIGSIRLPPALAAKAANGSPLTDHEARMVAERFATSARIIGSIPRLEGVREILQCTGMSFEPSHDAVHAKSREAIPLGARLLTLALEFDQLETEGHAPGEAIRILRGRQGRYDPRLMAALNAKYEEDGGQTILELSLTRVSVGMAFAEDVRSTDGTLMISRGQVVTASLVDRIENYWTDIPVDRMVRVTMPAIRNHGTEKAASSLPETA